jgi:hypothetical protein
LPPWLVHVAPDHGNDPALQTLHDEAQRELDRERPKGAIERARGNFGRDDARDSVARKAASRRPRVAENALMFKRLSAKTAPPQGRRRVATLSP